nr:kinase [Novosphingobium sp. BW1]
MLAALTGWLGHDHPRPLILGLCGAQGSGKSTLAAWLAERLGGMGMRAGILSIDDLYLGRVQRQDLAATVHPLFATRGVPGTHDVTRGCALLAALRAGTLPLVLPRFDKGRDEPAPQGEPVDAPLDVLIFEGWCVGARPQTEPQLSPPVNALEREEDPEGTWRRHVNTALACHYAPLFEAIDRLVLLAAPGFEVVRGWRGEQEAELRTRLSASSEAGREVMDAPRLDRFVQHYERLTRNILDEMPARADLVLQLAPDRSLRSQP